MKKWLIASGISCIPLFILGVANPFITMMSGDMKGIHDGRFIVYIIILAVCLSIILTTVLEMTRYTSMIDRMDEKEKQVNEEIERLQTLQRKYNRLILETENPSHLPSL